ncbi:Drug/Metabolite transporter (DMT) Superfamily [Phytophthora palmivora]|uniref:Drug/Metabolite transporter (DMT) Superfamily n=1 Tax=Phytophthora palmivora TaxID=4796 RepID=A0A2P4YFS6_9STRA|nr:Drug/Metabolite transporter (DMT) Superfamily [Phytophthora palmivora]
MASTARQATLLLLLTLQVGVQPLLMGWYASEARDVRLRVGVVEFLKLLLALIPLSLTRGDAGLLNQLKTWKLRAAMATTVLPALIYVLQNLLNHAAVVALDGVTFNVLNQTKIIWTALLVYLLLGTRQSPLQLVALGLLCAAAVLMTTPTMDKEDAEQRDDAVAFTGMYQALLAAVLSALAGSIIQRALQREKRNQYMVTVELSVLGELTLLVLAGVQDGLMQTGSDGDSQDMWEGWSIMTLAALMCQALGGVLVGFVIRDCGNVEKSFAVVGGMGLTALLETHFNGKPFGHNALVAMALVAISTALYTLNPPVKKTSADTSELEPFLAPPTVVTVSSNSVHTSSASRQEMRRSVRQLQPLSEVPTAQRVPEAIV